MPIVRRNETGERIAPRVLYLWNRKWWVIIPTIAMFFLTYFLMVFVKSDYAVSAEIYVNTLAVFQNNQASPQTVATLAKSHPLLYRVREEYVAKFGGEKPVFEKFARQFRVKQEILQDTTVNKIFSPVLQLTVSTTGREETQFLMQTWLRFLVEMYGNFATQEATQRLELLQREDARLDGELQRIESERALVAAELPMYRKTLAEYLNVIAPSELRIPQAPATIAPANENSSNVSMQVAVDQTTPPSGPGLISDLINAELELKALEAAGDTTSTEYQQAREDVATLNGLIEEVRTSATAIQAKVAELQQKFETASRNIDVMRNQRRQMHGFMDQVATIAALYREPGKDKVGAGDIRVLSQPILPELRVWPKRTLTALIVAIATALICTTAIMVYHSLREFSRSALAERRIG